MIQGQKELERKFAALEEVCDQQMEQLVGQQAKRIQAEENFCVLSGRVNKKQYQVHD